MVDEVLGEVLRRLRMKSCVYFQHDFGAPFRMTVPAAVHAQFHHVVEGNCDLDFDGRSYPLGPGDMVLFPSGKAHELGAGSSVVTMPGVEAAAVIQDGGSPFPGPQAAKVICGHFEMDQEARHPMFDGLPQLIVTRVSDDGDRLDGTSVSRLIIDEQNSEQAGAGAVIERLAEILLIRLLRRFVAESRDGGGFAGAMNDARLARAVRFIHFNAARDIGLADIADAAGMSRTVLAARFRDAVGRSPVAYLTYWRLLTARQLLAECDDSLAEIAHRTGYGSDIALSRAFKRTFQQTPGAFRAATAQ